MIDKDSLKIFSGVEAEGLGFHSDEELDDFLAWILEMATGLIEEYVGKPLDSIPAPYTVDGAVLMVSSNLIAQALARQDIELLRAGEYDTSIIDTDIIPDDVKEELDRVMGVSASFMAVYGDED